MVKRKSIISEYVAFLKAHKTYWMIPNLAVLLLLAGVLVFGGGAAAPFIYTLF